MISGERIGDRTLQRMDGENESQRRLCIVMRDDATKDSFEDFLKSCLVMLYHCLSMSVFLTFAFLYWSLLKVQTSKIQKIKNIFLPMFKTNFIHFLPR